MKKIISAILLCVVLLTACGKGEVSVETTVSEATEVTIVSENIETPSSEQCELYDEKIDEYRKALTMGRDLFCEKYDDGFDYSSINAMMVRYAYDYDYIIEYAICDIDNNGIKELAFSDSNDIIDIYTINDEGLCKLFKNCDYGDRSKIHIIDSGKVLAEGSSGALSGSCIIYQIDKFTNQLITEELYYYDGNGPDLSMKDYTYLSEDEYYEMLNRWKNESIYDNLNWMPIIEKKESYNHVILDTLQGFWIYPVTDYSCEMINFYDTNMYNTVLYPGAWDGEGTIESATEIADDTFELTIHYEETVQFEGEAPKPERWNIVNVSDIKDKESIVITFSSGTEHKYIYGGTTLEEAIEVFEKNSSVIPELDSTSKFLDMNFSTYKMNMGYSLNGPSDSWENNARKLFYLVGIDEVDCYFDTDTMADLIGVQDNNVVFYGSYGLSQYSFVVKDFLSNDSLEVKPAVYTIRPETIAMAGIDAYVWKIQNGYVAIIVTPMSQLDFYDQTVSSILYINDIKYLSYIDNGGM